MSSDIEKISKHRKEWELEKNKKSKDRDAKFITASSEPVELLAAPDTLAGFDYERDLGFPGEYPTHAEFITTCTAADSGQCASLQVLERRKIQIKDSTICWEKGRADFQSPLICPH